MRIYKTLKLALVLSSITISAKSADLQVSIDQINSDNGVILAQLFTGEENYKKSNSLDSKMLEAKKGVGQLIFKNLEPGDYVIRMYHDENNNQKMDKNAFGMPTEGYGFSNEAIGNMGPPKYKDMVVVIKEKDSVIKTIAKMIYL